MKKNLFLIIVSITVILFTSCTNINVDEEKESKYKHQISEELCSHPVCKMFIEINGKLLCERIPVGFIRKEDVSNDSISDSELKQIVGNGPYEVSYPVFVVYFVDQYTHDNRYWTKRKMPWDRIRKEPGISFVEKRMKVNCIKNSYADVTPETNYKTGEYKEYYTKYYYEYPSYEAIVIEPKMEWLDRKVIEKDDADLSFTLIWGENEFDSSSQRNEKIFTKNIIQELKSLNILPDIKEIKFTGKYIDESKLEIVPEIIEK